MGKGLPRSLGRVQTSDSVTPATLLKQHVEIAVDVDVSATGSAVGFGSVAIAGLPEGHIVMQGAVLKITANGSDETTNLTETWDGDVGVGTTAADDGTITGDDVNIINSTAFGAATSRISPDTADVKSDRVVIDNSDGTLQMNLNVLVDAASITDDTTVTLRMRGVLETVYYVLGDDDF